MSGRTPVVRFLAILWAALQVASPGVSAIADGRIARENATRPATHVEATTTAACPVVHSPDCGVCRYLATGATTHAAASLAIEPSAANCKPTSAGWTSLSAAVALLPDGRAPPVS